ncbi:MAG: oligosaccharide flippase family protein [Candidatus Micrarchaeia archaeon]
MEEMTAPQKEKHALVDTFAKGTLYKFGSMGIIKAISFITTLLIINFLLPAQADLFFEANAIAITLSSFCGLGLSVAAIRYIPAYMVKKEFGKVKTQIWTSIAALAGICIIVAIFAVIFEQTFADYYGAGIIPLIPLCMIGMTGLIFLVYLGSTLNALKQFGVSSAASAAMAVLKVILIGGVIAAGIGTAYTIMGAFAASQAIVAMYMMWHIYGKFKEHENAAKFDFGILRRDAAFGLPVYISGMLDTLVTQIDVLMIGIFLGENPGVVAGYSAVVLIVRNIGPMIFSPISDVQQPMLVEHFEAKNEFTSNIIRETTRWTMYLGIPFLCMFLIFSAPILQIMAKPYWENAWLVWAFAPFVISTLVSISSRNALLARGHVKILLVVSAIAVGLNVVLNIVLIPIIGVLGAAIASSIAAVIGESYAVIKARQMVGARLHPDILKAFAAGAVMVGLSFIALPGMGSIFDFSMQGIIQLVIAVCISYVIYGIAFLVVKGINAKDWHMIYVFLEKNKLGIVVSYLKPVSDALCKYTG